MVATCTTDGGLQGTSARLALYKIIVLPYGISGCKCDENAIPGDQLWRDLIMSASSGPQSFSGIAADDFSC